MPTPTENPLPFCDGYWERHDRRRNAGIYNTCACCGRGVKPKAAKWVAVVNGGGLISNDPRTDESQPGYMGMYPVGSRCAKKLVPGSSLDYDQLGWGEVGSDYAIP